MKYLKFFENYNEEYKVDDYILLKDSDDKSVKPEAKIIDIEGLDSNLKIANINIRITYEIEIFDEFDNLIKSFVYAEEIDRLLTPDEIKEYEIKKDANKYNL